ncbi:hypothetical protein [Escherichia phage phiWec179]|jgi:hypothetical protein|nr:hypothetical protein [Escherichia phage phiWec179]BDU12572.1 hypothetical protein [Escherichia phage phiWec181]BDU12717.1 hypothetical protein [Escherichia phage phiWec186]
MSITLTGNEIFELFEMLGMNYSIEKDPELLDVSITVLEDKELLDDNGNVMYKGRVAFYTDYPEEGGVGIQEENYV